MFLLNNMTEEEVFELQRSLVTFRVNAVVGLWEDVITGEVVEIRVLPKTDTRKELTYAAYAVLDRDLDSVVRFTTSQEDDAAAAATTEVAQPPVNVLDNAGDPNADESAPSLETFTTMVINKSLAWLSKDLKMEFSATSGSGFFLDDEKMINDAIVYFHPAKGLIVVALPNKEFRYYKPIVPDMYPALEDSLYNSRNVVATNVDQDNIARFSAELDSTPGTTNYFLYPGVTLGIIAAFFLIAI
jgi:hypothetical protein